MEKYPLPINQLSDNTDEVMHQHIQQFQKTLLNVVDDRVANVKHDLKLKEQDVQMLSKEKHVLGMQLCHVRQELDRLNSMLANLNVKLIETSSWQKITDQELNQTEQERGQLETENLLLKQSLAKTINKVESLTTNVSNLTDINCAYFSDIKVQKRITSKLERELKITEEKRKWMQSDSKDLSMKHEKLIQEHRNIERILNTQKKEAAQAKEQAKSLEKELNSMKHMKEAKHKQWEDVWNAMTKRDLVLQNVKQKHDSAKTIADTALKEIEHSQSQINHLSATVISLEAQAKETIDDLLEAKSSSTIRGKQIEKMNNESNMMSERLLKQKQQLGWMHLEKSRMELKYQDMLKTEVANECGKREEKLLKQTEKKFTVTVREHEGRHMHLRNDNTRLKLRIHESVETAQQVQSDADMLLRQHHQLENHYNHIYEDSQYLTHELERKHHDVNLLQSQLLDMKQADSSKPLKMELKNVQKELSVLTEDYEKLKNMWLESQKCNLNLKEEIQKLKEDNRLKTSKIYIKDNVHVKREKEIEGTKKDLTEKTLEFNRLYAELEKYQANVAELNIKNAELETELQDARLSVLESNSNIKTNTSMLKAQINRLSKDKEGLRRDQHQDVKSMVALEQKYLLLKEKYAKVSHEKQQVLRQNNNLRNDIDHIRRKNHQMIRDHQKFMELATKSVKNRSFHSSPGNGPSENGSTISPVHQGGYTPNGNLDFHDPFVSLASTPIQTPGGGKVRRAPTHPPASVSSEKEQQETPEVGPIEIPDFMGMKLRIQSLQCENDKLESENNILRKQANELSNRMIQLGNQLIDAQDEVKEKENEVLEYQQQLENTLKRCTRAEKIASYIEHQFKLAKPNIKIDYHYPSDIEASTQLLASLIANFQEEKSVATSIFKNIKSRP